MAGICIRFTTHLLRNEELIYTRAITGVLLPSSTSPVHLPDTDNALRRPNTIQNA